MNESPEETPNPLNPTPEFKDNLDTLDANPAEPIQEAPASVRHPMPTIDGVRPIRQRSAEARFNQPNEQLGSVDETHTTESFGQAGPIDLMGPIGPVDDVTPTDSASVPTDPMARPMEKAAMPEQQPVKKKKTGLIATIIAIVIVSICGGVAAAIIAMNANKVDPVAAAMQKLMSNQTPSNVGFDGVISLTTNDSNSMVKKLNVDLKSSIVVNSLINTSAAKLTATMSNDSNLSLNFDEAYAANGDLYLKIDGLANALRTYSTPTLQTNNTTEVDCEVDEFGESNCLTEEVDCIDGEDCETLYTQIDTDVDMSDLGEPVQTDWSIMGYMSNFAGKVDQFDGKWLKISTDELNALSGEISNSAATCVTNLISGINTNSNSAAELYNRYPFIISSKDNIPISSKGNQVYKVNIDSKNFADYINSIQNTKLLEDVYDCMGWENNIHVDKSDVDKLFSNAPDVYVEIDDNYNFTRLYMEKEQDNYVDCDCAEDEVCDCLSPANNNSKTTLLVDLAISYPANVTVTEPVDALDFSEVMQSLFLDALEYNEQQRFDF